MIVTCPIGQINRQLKTRIAEHQNDINKSKPTNSVIYQLGQGENFKQWKKQQMMIDFRNDKY